MGEGLGRLRGGRYLITIARNGILLVDSTRDKIHNSYWSYSKRMWHSEQCSFKGYNNLREVYRESLAFLIKLDSL